MLVMSLLQHVRHLMENIIILSYSHTSVTAPSQYLVRSPTSVWVSSLSFSQ